MKIPFLSLNRMHAPLRSELLAATAQVLDAGWYVNGPEVRDFEREWADYLDTDFAVGVSNGLDALELSLRALNIGAGDEVIIPSNTYIASALAATHVGAHPVFVEPNPETHLVHPGALEAARSSKTRCVIPVHLYGQSVNMQAVMEWANQHHIAVVEDNAQAHGATWLGKRTGSWGHANATSFYPGKNLGALGDAGAVTTSSSEIANRIRRLKNYGSETKYYNMEVGFNKRLDELQAAVLRVKLRHLDAWTTDRQRIAQVYLLALRGVGDLVLPITQQGATHVYHQFVIQTSQRKELIEHLTQRGIGTLIHYPVPPHLQDCYASLGHQAGDFPVAESLSERVLSLPIWPGMTEEEVQTVMDAVRAFF